jgi:hypothetical protein
MAMSTEPQQPRRPLRWTIVFIPLVVLLLGSGLTVWLSIGSTNSHVGPEGVLVFNVPDVAGASSTLGGRTVDGISCRTEAKEVVKYHVHVHVTIYFNGDMQRLPAGIGITKPQAVEHYSAGPFIDVGIYDCLYWLHTHVADGIIHVEAPAKQQFTLGQFFDIWNQPLDRKRVGPDKGNVVVFENGKRLNGNPRAIPLLPHGVIQIDVGSPVVLFQPFAYKVTGGCGEGTNSCKSGKL